MKRILSILGLFIALSAAARELPVHCAIDTAKVNQLIAELKTADRPTGERMVAAARAFAGAEKDDYYFTDSIGTLRINVDSFSPLMFINNVVALAKTSENPGLNDWRTFAREFEDISCRRGEFTGYPSIMYHTSDWIGDNISRGNVTELTENFAGAIPRTKSLDEMTRKRGNFAALADSTTFETVRMVEMGFRTHRVPSLKKETIKKKELVADLQDGDIIILVPNRDGIDVYDIGVITMKEGLPYLIHVSPTAHKVVEEEEDLARYMSLMTKYFQGYRILRLK